MTEIPTNDRNSDIAHLFDQTSDMKLFVLLLILKLDSLPPAPVLHAAMDAHHDTLLSAQLEEFQTNQGKFWMNFVPSTGLAYTPDGAPRPALSFSLSQVSTAFQQRSGQRAKQRSIAANSEIGRERAHRELDAMVRHYEMMGLELDVMRQVHEINTSLYELALSDYEAAKSPPSEFLPKKKSYLQEQLNLRRKEMELKELEGDILLFANY